MKKSVIRHTSAFLLSVLVAVLFLLLGACVPQAPIDDNIRDSAANMVKEGDYPFTADHSYASMLDYTTDALILSTSKATTIQQWETVFTNPQYTSKYSADSTVEKLYQYSLDPEPETDYFYVHYWMGFRPVVRLLLSFFDYYQILRYTAVIIFVLFAAVICSIASRCGTRTAFLFALSIIAVRPHVVAVSLQFSCCFIIAFLAMLAVPWIHRTKKWESLFFLELGILTQYFDFYTTPVLTFALPMIYLYLLRVRDNAPNSLKAIGVNAMNWIAGYILMWVAKLLLTSLFTDVNALSQGFSAFSGRVGIEKESGLEYYYNPVIAIYGVFVSLYSDHEGRLVLYAVVAVTALWLIYRFLRDRHTLPDLLPHWQLLLLAAVPVVWFLVAAQPTAIHHWFQYRSIAASFWAGLLYLQLLLQRKPDVPSPQ